MGIIGISGIFLIGTYLPIVFRWGLMVDHPFGMGELADCGPGSLRVGCRNLMRFLFQFLHRTAVEQRLHLGYGHRVEFNETFALLQALANEQGIDAFHVA